MKAFNEVFDRITSNEQIPENELEDYIVLAICHDIFIPMVQHQKLTKCLIIKYSNFWCTKNTDYSTNYYYHVLKVNAEYGNNEHNVKIINEIINKIEIFK